ncbi:hypothetical protein [Ascidiimonas aurantiaca]|uniref:hypothetical protein n=1 Tax=Ascidiimonas aurantiaca TaxID=1685432 RepID=UPI0030ED6F65
MSLKDFIKREKIFSFIFLFSLLATLRTLIIPLQGDELTYSEIADNILLGKYYFSGNPSTVTPVIPFILAFFKISTVPTLGFVLGKLLHILLTILGFRYLYLFLAQQNIDFRVILSIMALTAVNSHAISFFPGLYPEAILFFAFWGFMYYFNTAYTQQNLLKLFALFLLLAMTRYLYLVMGVLVVYHFYEYYKKHSLRNIYSLLPYLLLLILPFVFWFKYVYHIEQNNVSEISYFDRFKSENPFLYNIKAGLGLIKHYEVSRTNGIPAFISLFVPVTGLRNFLGSLFLIISFILGYLVTKKTKGMKWLFISILLVMAGLIVAGTGFSRYWLILLPGFLTGYYFLSSKLTIGTKWFVTGSQILCFVYLLNELRLNVVLLHTYF